MTGPLDISDMKVEDLHREFGVDVFVPANTISALTTDGRPTGGLIDQAAENGAANWDARRDRPVLFRGQG